MKPSSFRQKPKPPKIAGNGLVKGLTKKTQLRTSRTENGAVTHASTTDACVNLFFTMNASRTWSKDQKLSAFIAAWEQDPLVAMKLLFWSRDVREGAGERSFFRTIVGEAFSKDTTSLGRNYWPLQTALVKNLELFPLYGRWDDLWKYDVVVRDELFDQILVLIRKGLKDGDALLAKWLPTQGVEAAVFRFRLGYSPKAWRKRLVELRKVVETPMSARQWGSINYSHVPSVAMHRYKKAFRKRDKNRFEEYIAEVLKPKDQRDPKVKINASVLFPHDLVHAARSGYSDAVEAQWQALPPLKNGGKAALVMVDVSPSMTSKIGSQAQTEAIDVSLGLGIYMSERLNGPFKDSILSFSGAPRFIQLSGTLKDKIGQAYRDHGYTTNLQAAFDLVLSVAVETGVKTEDMPDTILVISDMEFNSTEIAGKTNLDVIRQKYQRAGYVAPKIVFWNVQSRSQKNFAAAADDPEVALVSGYSPQIAASFMGADLTEFSPRNVMLKTINSPRYESIRI